MSNIIAEGQPLREKQILFMAELKNEFMGTSCPVCKRDLAKLEHNEQEFFRFFIGEEILTWNATVAFRYPPTPENVKKYGLERLYSKANCLVVNSPHCALEVTKSWQHKFPPWETEERK